ncbi:alanine racemase [Arenicella xantha]|nr:alanine racemase [Arenicella xantha]
MSIVKTQHRATHVVIDTAAYQHNLRVVKDLLPGARIMAIIKADGYGHGMELAADALQQADEFGVTCQDDAERLRAHGINKPLTLLSSRFTHDELSSFGAKRWRPVVYDLAQLDAFEQLPVSAALDIWLKIDTGMGRLGFSLAEAPEVLDRLRVNPGVQSISLMTHLANADCVDHPGNHYQFDRFDRFRAKHTFAQHSILNSAGCVGFPGQALDIVRPGLILYGVSPQSGEYASALPLKPVMTFKSALLSVRQVSAGTPIGYGSTYAVEQDTRIGIVAAGYGDGYPRHAPSGTPVFVNGTLVPLIGRVSMDLITIDLGQVEASVGDEVVLWGAENPVEIVAQNAETIAYELTCGITPRVERIII